jgi:hypothetical protein
VGWSCLLSACRVSLRKGEGVEGSLGPAQLSAHSPGDWVCVKGLQGLYKGNAPALSPMGNPRVGGS